MAVAVGDTPVTIMDAKFGGLILANFSRPSNRSLLSVVMATGSQAAAPFDIPTSV